MPTTPTHGPNEELLVRYLLGALEEAESERLDEASIVDDEFARRLADAENDLVDDYVAGRLSREIHARFEAVYMAVPERRAKVDFARSFRQVAEGSQEGRVGAAARAQGRRHAPLWTAGRWALPLGVAACLLAAGLYFFAGRAHQPEQAKTGRPAETPTAPVRKEIIVGSLLLAPQRRGTDSLPQFTLAAKAEDRAVSSSSFLELKAELEFDDFPRYEVVLRAAASKTPLWTSDPLQTEVAGGTRVIIAKVPVALLAGQTYVLDVNGAPASGQKTLVSSYAFRVVTR